MIHEAKLGESKYVFFERVFDRNGDNTYVFNDVRIELKRGILAFELAARLHDAMCRIQQLESQYRR